MPLLRFTDVLCAKSNFGCDCLAEVRCMWIPVAGIQYWLWVFILKNTTSFENCCVSLCLNAKKFRWTWAKGWLMHIVQLAQCITVVIQVKCIQTQSHTVLESISYARQPNCFTWCTTDCTYELLIKLSNHKSVLESLELSEPTMIA